MTDILERVCRGCGVSEGQMRLEACGMCHGYFCADCAHRAGFGRRYCSTECAHAYYFSGDPEDDDEHDDDDDP